MQIFQHLYLILSFQKHLLIAVTFIVGTSCQIYTRAGSDEYKYQKRIVSRQAIPQTAEKPSVLKRELFYTNFSYIYEVESNFFSVSTVVQDLFVVPMVPITPIVKFRRLHQMLSIKVCNTEVKIHNFQYFMYFANPALNNLFLSVLKLSLQHLFLKLKKHLQLNRKRNLLSKIGRRNTTNGTHQKSKKSIGKTISTKIMETSKWLMLTLNQENQPSH